MNKKVLIIGLLIVLGLYWLLDHVAPMPLSHESFGLYNHDMHRLFGVILFIGAGIVAWRMKAK